MYNYDFLIISKKIFSCKDFFADSCTNTHERLVQINSLICIVGTLREHPFVCHSARLYFLLAKFPLAKSQKSWERRVTTEGSTSCRVCIGRVAIRCIRLFLSINPSWFVGATRPSLTTVMFTTTKKSVRCCEVRQTARIWTRNCTWLAHTTKSATSIPVKSCCLIIFYFYKVSNKRNIIKCYLYINIILYYEETFIVESDNTQIRKLQW